MVDKSRWFTLARNTSKSRAKAALEDLIIREFGGEDAHNRALADPRTDWEYRLNQSKHLEELFSRRLNWRLTFIQILGKVTCACVGGLFEEKLFYINEHMFG